MRDARRTAFEILQRVEQAGAFASILLEQREGDLADPRDAALLHELVLGVLRRLSPIDHVLARLTSRPLSALDPGVRAALRLGAYALLYLDRIPPFAAVNSAVELIKSSRKPGGAGLANAVLRAVSREGRAALPPAAEPGDVEGLALQQGHPPWWVRRVVARLGWDAAARLLEEQNRPAPTVLQANPRLTTPARLAEALLEEGVVTRPGSIRPEALRVESGSVRGGRLLREGHFWVQDEASQLVPMLLGSPLGPRVADLCAAPGGKSFQLAGALPSGGTLVAIDRHRTRLGRLRRAAQRLDARGVVIVQADMTRRAPFSPGAFDQLLVDAPCSGSGTLRRHPEIRWRLSLEDLKLFAKRQARLLETAAELTAPGGTMVYSVCSMEPEEGEQVVRGFLDVHRQFCRDDARLRLPRAGHHLVDDRGYLRTTPLDHGMDGFFAALLARRR